MAFANGKPSVASPKESSTGHVELDDVQGAQTTVPIQEDIMQLARLGEVAAIQALFDSGKFDSSYKDEQGITPLHVCRPFSPAGTA